MIKLETMKKLIIILLCFVWLLPLRAQNMTQPKIAGPNGLWVNRFCVIYQTKVKKNGTI